MEPGEEFGPWLGRQLQRQNLTQAGLAAKVGVTRAAVSAWITGRAQPRPETIRQIAEAFGTDLTTVYTRVEDAVPAHAVTWYHRPAHADGGREFGNPAAFAFDADLGVLAREATQNSLDEQHDPTHPVRVRFTLHELTGEQLANFLDALQWNSLKAHYHAAASSGQKVSRALADGLRELESSGSLLLLRVDDYNANGLTGPEYGDGRFAAVVRRQLDNHKVDKQRAGGSYGLGKATLWAASRFGLVLINSTLSEPHEGRTARRVIGRLDLPWRQVGGEAFAGPAWFGEPDSDREFPGVSRSWWAVEKETADLHLEREGDAPGTTFLVVGAQDAAALAAGDDGLQAMHDKLCDSLSENFWAAMTGTADVPPLLQASVRTLRNGKELIPETHVSPDERQPALARALRAHLNGTTVEEITSLTDVVSRTVPLTVPPLRSEGRGAQPVTHEAVLLVTPAVDNDLRPNEMVSMRGNRMKISVRRPRDLGVGVEPFQAVLLAGFATGRTGSDVGVAETFLRASEPPEHDRWEYTEELATAYVRGARRRLDEFRAAADAALRSVVGIRAAAPADGSPPELLRKLLQLAPGGSGPAPRRRGRGHPVIDDIDGSVDESGAWVLSVRIAVPQQDDACRLVAVPHIGVDRADSGARVRWRELTAMENCAVDGDVVVVAPGVRSAAFTGITDVDSHPVAPGMASVSVSLRKAEEGSTRS